MPLREIPGREIEGEIEDLEAEIEGGADLVDRRAAGREILQHLPCHRLGKRRDALRHDAMIAGEDADQRPVDGGPALALPGGEPFGDLLHAAEAAGRLGQFLVAGAHHVGRRHVGTGHRGDELADVVEGES